MAARRLLEEVMADREGWSIFGAEMTDEGQEAANDLARALAELNLSEVTR